MVQRIGVEVFPVDLDEGRTVQVDGQCCVHARTLGFLLVEHFIDVLWTVACRCPRKENTLAFLSNQSQYCHIKPTSPEKSDSRSQNPLTRPLEVGFE